VRLSMDGIAYPVIGVNLLVLTFSLPLSESALTFQQRQAQLARQTHFLDEVVARVRAIPSVESAGLTGALPIADPDGFPDGLFLILNGQPAPTNFDDWGRMAQNPKQTGQADYAVASREFFRTAGIPLIRGRLFEAQDGPDAPNVAVISETLAREKWPNQNPVGQRIDFSNMDGILKPLTIVGVVGDIRAEGLDQPPSRIIYVDYRQRGLGANSSPAIVLRTALPASAIVPAARGIFHDLNPNIPMEFSTFARALGGWLAERRFLLLLAGLFAGAALALADFISVDWLPTLGVQPILGRNFMPDEERPGHDGVVILTNDCWRERFGADSKILGRGITLDGRSYTVIPELCTDFVVIPEELLNSAPPHPCWFAA
jgi:putative ABC transport system permease protein